MSLSQCSSQLVCSVSAIAEGSFGEAESLVLKTSQVELSASTAIGGFDLEIFGFGGVANFVTLTVAIATIGRSLVATVATVARAVATIAGALVTIAVAFVGRSLVASISSVSAI